MSCFTSIRSGRIPTLMLLASTTTCRCRIGASMVIRSTGPSIRRQIRPICEPGLRVVRALTGIMPATPIVLPDCAARYPIFTAKTGSGATRISAAGGKTRITNGKTASARHSRHNGFPRRSRYGSPNSDARQLPWVPMSRMSFPTPSLVRPDCRDFRPAGEMIWSNTGHCWSNCAGGTIRYLACLPTGIRYHPYMGAPCWSHPTCLPGLGTRGPFPLFP